MQYERSELTFLFSKKRKKKVNNEPKELMTQKIQLLENSMGLTVSWILLKLDLIWTIELTRTYY